MQTKLQDRKLIIVFKWMQGRGVGLGEQKGFTKDYTDTSSEAYVYYLGFGDCFNGCIHISSYKLCILNICSVCPLYFNKAIKNFKLWSGQWR